MYIVYIFSTYLRMIGVVDQNTLVVTTVHDLQLVPAPGLNRRYHTAVHDLPGKSKHYHMLVGIVHTELGGGIINR